MMFSEMVTDEKLPGLNPVQFGWETCSPGHDFGPAVRTHWLLHYIVSGKGIFRENGHMHSLHSGQIFVIRPYEETYYRADESDPWHYIWIGFTASAPLPDALSLPVITLREAGAVFDDMLHCSDREQGRSAYLSGCLWKLVSLLQQGEPKGGYVEKALSFMHAEYMHGITVQNIAGRLGLNRSYFYTLFKQQTGCSPGEYLLRLRLEKAAELMRLYRESPSTAAASAGYPDVCQFSRIFKQHYGISPREYRKARGGALPPEQNGGET